MTQCFEIRGGRPLVGEVLVSGAKNAALPLMIASLLSPDPCTLRNVPNIQDVHLTIKLLEHFGATVRMRGAEVWMHTPILRATEASYSLVKALRASFWVLGPLLARGKAARVALPGGDVIGARPVDMHLEALTAMGADITVRHGTVYATAVSGLKPAVHEFHFPSVGATHQVLMAASLVSGTTRILGAAREPEVVELASFLEKMGVKIEGAGTSEISITGGAELSGGELSLIGDRIEAATYILATVASRGRSLVRGFIPEHLGDFLSILSLMGVGVHVHPDGLLVDARSVAKPLSIVTAPFPGLATDIQAPLMAALCTIAGESHIEETVFEGRFGHVSELCRMGARIKVCGKEAKVQGQPALSAAVVEAHDIRAGAALLIAALAAPGVTRLLGCEHLRRGYDRLEEKVQALGGQIALSESDHEDYMFTGC